MGKHDRRQTELKDRICELRLLRDAQEPESQHWFNIQDQINKLTANLLEWENNADLLAGLDRQVRSAETRLRVAQDKAEKPPQPWTLIASSCGGLGAVLLLSYLLWSSAVWMPITVVGLFGVAGVAVQRSLAAKQAALKAVAAATEALAAAQRQRVALRTPVSARR